MLGLTCENIDDLDHCGRDKTEREVHDREIDAPQGEGREERNLFIRFMQWRVSPSCSTDPVTQPLVTAQELHTGNPVTGGVMSLCGCKGPLMGRGNAGERGTQRSKRRILLREEQTLKEEGELR